MRGSNVKWMTKVFTIVRDPFDPSGQHLCRLATVAPGTRNAGFFGVDRITVIGLYLGVTRAVVRLKPLAEPPFSW